MQHLQKHRGVGSLWLTRSHLINARTSRKGRHLQDETVETQPNHDFPPDSITADLWFCCHKTIYEITSSSVRRFFCRGGRERLRGICGGWDEWRWRDRWRCGCVTVEDPCALVRARSVREFWDPNAIFLLGLPSLRLAIRRPCFPSRVP